MSLRPFLSAPLRITLKEVTEGLEEFNERWRSIEYFSSLPISGVGAKQNGESDSLSGDRLKVSQDRTSVMGTPPSIRRRPGRGAAASKPGYSRPPSIESTKATNSSQESAQTEWSIGGDSFHSRSPEVDFTYFKQTYQTRYKLDGSLMDSAAHDVLSSQASLPLHPTESDEAADLAWRRSSAPNLQELPSKLAGLSTKKLMLAKSERVEQEELPPIIEASPVPSRSNSELPNGSGANSNFSHSPKVGRGWKLGSASDLQ